LQGSITFGLPQEGRQIHLSAGDRLDLPAGIDMMRWWAGRG
jgi:hypothetical protein